MKHPRASIALISILIISAFALILVVGMSTNSLSAYDQSFNTEASDISSAVADACLEEALLRFENDNTFASTSLTLDADTNCTVAISGSGPYTISITVHFLDYTQNFEATVQITQSGQIYNSELLSWEEV